MASSLGKSLHSNGKDPHTISYTKTFDVQHADNDETLLVHMDDFAVRKHKGQGSSSTSVVSL